jgi:aminopeptidase N
VAAAGLERPRCGQPTAEAKAAAWAQLTGPAEVPNWRHRALLSGFHHPSQVALTRPYLGSFFETAATVWDGRDGPQAREFVTLGYPRYHVDPATVDLTDAWLAEPGHPAPLRRLMAEGRDAVVRALAARRCDQAASG